MNNNDYSCYLDCLIYLLRNEVFPCEEFEGVPLSTMIKIVNSIETEVNREGKVVVHCRAGQGRTGTVLGKLMILTKSTTHLMGFFQLHL